MRYNAIFFVIFSFLILLSSVVHAAGNRPLTTDVRIRTLVYNENEVFKLVTAYGYQASIEFGKEEKINTISLGDPIPFQITPDGNRIFIKAKQNNMFTNMTVLTDKRSYQFELSSIVEDKTDIIYLMRFYYPEDGFHDTYSKEKARAVNQQQNIKTPVQQTEQSPGGSLAAKPNFNYNYSITGPEQLSPRQIFDDGRSTFFKFAGQPAQVSLVTPDGKESPVNVTNIGGFFKADVVSPRFSLRWGEQIICVYNEALSR